MKYLALILVVASFLALATVSYVLLTRQTTLMADQQTPASSSRVESPESSPIAESTSSPSSASSATAAVSSYYYPMTSYLTRITNRGYGKAITAADRNPLPCGSPFEGFHTGDDLEVTAGEIDQETPVFAIADGTVDQVSDVGGYGGLVVIEHQLNGQTVTVYYGHINRLKASVKKGEKVKAGQQITILGNNCSGQTSNERKHLHFAIHSGKTVDVRGYVKTEEELKAWLNPSTVLAELQAK